MLLRFTQPSGGVEVVRSILPFTVSSRSSLPAGRGSFRRAGPSTINDDF